MGTAHADKREPAREDAVMFTFAPAQAAGGRATPDEIEADERRTLDPRSRQWIERLRPGHTRREEAIASLAEFLRDTAGFELNRRRHRLGWVSGQEFDDLAQQAAHDALLKILDRLDDFRGLSRFTTWAAKFSVFEVSTLVARHAWHRQAPSSAEPAWEQLPDAVAPAAEDRLHQQAQLRALARAIDELTERQRDTFVSIALNGADIDTVALRLDSNRNAIYKCLFDARRSLRAKLAEAGYPVRGTST
jgi:RNA polymerase sigma-70 factor (ECF subfamily)